ncbi:hypothetical protein TELCIR_20039, partial [Teladorsagia circumcincta]
MLRWTAGVTRLDHVRNDTMRNGSVWLPSIRCAKLAFD